MAEKQVLDLTGLTRFLTKLRDIFSPKDHTHPVDTALSATSTNPVQNKVVQAEFDTVKDSISKISAGDTVVAEATHATSADTATKANNATYAASAGSAMLADEAIRARSADNAIVAERDVQNRLITETYETKADAAQKLVDAKEYADEIKDDLLNGAGDAYDTLKELGDLISENVTAIDALEAVAAGKADKVHMHAIADVTNLQTTLDAMQGEIGVNESSISSHTGNGDIHVTAAKKANWDVAYTHSQEAHAPSNAEKNQNAFSNVLVGNTTIAADTATDTLTLVAGSNVTLTPDASGDSVTIASKDTTYSAGTGISLSGTTFSNSGVRSVASGSTNGTISVNTNGTSAEVAVKGLGSAAYTASSAYAPASHSHDNYTLKSDFQSLEARVPVIQIITWEEGD